MRIGFQIIKINIFLSFYWLNPKITQISHPFSIKKCRLNDFNTTTKKIKSQYKLKDPFQFGLFAFSL